MRKFAVTAILLAAFLVATPRTWAWGCQGHQVVAYIAYSHLTAQAQAQANSILKDPTGKYTAPLKGFEACGTTTLGAMSTFSTWADAIRPRGAAWHFWDIPLAIDSASMPLYCGDQGCIISALTTQIDVLRSNSSSADAKHEALMFIIHFLGDLHQPMHIVDNGDRGGNCVPVKYGGTNPKEGKDRNGNPNGSYEPNLHSIWDSNMISADSGSKGKSDRDSTSQSFAADIEKHENGIAKDEADRKFSFATESATLVKWASATHELAGPSSYARLPTALPVDPHPKTLTSCDGVSNTFFADNEHVEQPFTTNADKVIEKQLALAGGRLASILNAIFQ